MPRDPDRGLEWKENVPKSAPTTTEVIIFVLEKIMLHEHQQGIRIIWQYTYSRFKEVIQIKLAFENSIFRWTRADANTLRRCREADLFRGSKDSLFFRGFRIRVVPTGKTEQPCWQHFDVHSVIECFHVV